jgi:1-acyl-sn-glycerol-3-phosphate acyltransferase
MRDARELIRIGARAGAFVGATVGYLGRLELERWVAGRARRDEALVYKWVPRWARALLGIYAVTVEAAGAHVAAGRLYPGRDARGLGRVFVMNHRSGLDVLVAFTLAEAFLVSRADLGGWPLIGLGARRVRTLFVDRASRRSGAAVMRAMIRCVEGGLGVMLFPEGTSHAGDDVRPLQPGAFQLAARTGAEIVPIGIAWNDARAVYGEESFLSHLGRVSALSGLRAAVEIGDALRPDGRGAAELRDATRTALAGLVRRARVRLGCGG